MATTDTDTGLNYRGDLFLHGANSRVLSFTNAIGGADGSRSLTSNAFTFPTSVVADLENASQPAIDEDTAQTAPTAVTTAQTQAYNTCQIHHYQRDITYRKQSDTATLSGLATIGNVAVTNPREFQVQMALKQMFLDVEYSFLNGAYQAAANSSTAGKTRGLIAACTTNTVACGSNDISKAYINALLEEMYNAGAPMDNLIMFIKNGYIKSKVSDIYGYAPTDRFVGGVNIKQIETDYAPIGVVLAPHSTSGTVLIADVAHCAPVFNPVTHKNANGEEVTEDIVVEDLAKTGAADAVQVYGHVGLAYGPESYHGTLTGVATS